MSNGIRGRSRRYRQHLTRMLPLQRRPRRREPNTRLVAMADTQENSFLDSTVKSRAFTYRALSAAQRAADSPYLGLRSFLLSRILRGRLVRARTARPTG